jgi:gluconolactonase
MITAGGGGASERVPSIDLETTVLAAGLGFVEGPCVDEHDVLYVVEMSRRRILVIHDGRAATWVTLPGSPNGAAFGPDRQLYVCDGGGRWPPYPSTGGLPGPGDQPGLVWRISPQGTPSILIRELEGRPLNGPNDLCFDDRGGFYFTDPEWEAPVGSVRRGQVGYATTDGRAGRAWEGIRFPNGLHVTPDGEALLVGETDTGLIHRFPIVDAGRLGDPTVYADLGPSSGLDGMCFDITGRLIVAASTGGCLFVVAPGGGSVEKIIRSEDPCPTNVCFGGPERRTLFVTEGGHGRVISGPWDVPGLTLFPDR